MKEALLTAVVFSTLLNAVGASPCDGLSAEVFVHPTEPHLLAIRLENDGTANFNYPSMNLLLDGELIATGETVFFGWPAVSYTLIEADFVAEENASYTFTIEVYSIFGSTFECAFEVISVPYTVEECFQGFFMLGPTAGVAQEIEFKLTSATGTDVINENVWLASNNPFAQFNACLNRDCFTLRVESVGSTFQANYLITFEYEGFVWFSRLVNQGQSVAEFTLDFWQGCSFVAVPERTRTHTTPLFAEVARTQTLIQALDVDQAPPLVRLYSNSGRLIDQTQSWQIRTPRQPGLYILNWDDGRGLRGAQRLLVVD